MRWKTYTFLCFLLSSFHHVHAQPGNPSNNIKIDQFGYYPAARKVAVITRPVAGFNFASEGGYRPGTGSDAFQVRRRGDNSLVYSGTLLQWNGGATHSQSGDKGWWFDFSAVTTPGTYYIYDSVNNVSSYPFTISGSVYNEALRQALRVFFYQRINYAKQPPFADIRWADGAAFEGAGQDRSARSLDNNDPKDLSGGWMDAGDYNKYTTFAAEAVLPLLEAYRSHPSVFGDNNGIPESGNGVADVLDEVKWEVDWYKRMQDATGSTRGLFLKVGVISWNSASPASADNNPRYYVGECTSATICGAAVFALSSTVYRGLGGSWTTYADDLLQRAKDAWSRASVVTRGFASNFNTTCDDQTVKAGDADLPVQSQRNMVFAAAVYLYEATGAPEYKAYIDANYGSTYPFAAGYWGPYFPVVQKALLRYAALPTTPPTPGAPFATESVAAAIRLYKAEQDGSLSISDYDNGTDLYRSFMPSGDYAWGSNRSKCNAAMNNFDAYNFGINPARGDKYKETGEAYLHYLHGVNALGLLMLTNMYNYGGDRCANQISHAWFRDGSDWDDALTSIYGPPPGYLTGGCNQDYAVSTITPPFGQPALKAYKDWNTDWNRSNNTNETSYVITEPSISNQAAYVAALSDLIANNGYVPSADFIRFTATPASDGAQLSWEVSASDDLRQFVVERSDDGRRYQPIATVDAAPGLWVYTHRDDGVQGNERVAWYRIKVVELAREAYSDVRQLGTMTGAGWKLSPNPAASFILLEGQLAMSTRVTLEVRNSAGILLRSENRSGTAGPFQYRIGIDGLPAGLYWLRVLGAGEATLPFVKR
ncbi:glycoside hydrolase family 9 protein [Flaviaesturariibacter terrae]